MSDLKKKSFELEGGGVKDESLGYVFGMSNIP